MMPDDLPTLNAILNGTSAVLVSLGYVAIKKQHVRLHRNCMLSAVVVSALFLTSYLYYHFAVRAGQPTRFSGEGWLRALYFTILLSHTVLAVVVTPMVLTSVYLGLWGRLDRHVRLARWTVPLWIYVSITGVVVYWMLYRL